MGLRIVVLVVALAALTAVHGSPAVTARPAPGSVEVTAHPNSVPQVVENPQVSEEEAVVEEAAEDDVMETGDLNPDYYPAQRAAKVVQHYLNTRYGSPYRWLSLHSVQSAHVEEVAGSGRRYRLELTVQEFLSNTTEKCSAEVVFPAGQGSPSVQASCEGLNVNATAEEEALYQQYKSSNNLVSGNNIPDSHGHVEPDMKPLWHLGGVASSFVMLRESNQSTLYNMAQVANVTQLETENEQLRFDYHVLMHEMITQEIVHWKLQVTWSPAEGVKVSQMENLPKCHHCVVPPNTTHG